MPEFRSWNSFVLFRREVTRKRRYIWTPEAQDFLQAVALTCKARLQTIDKGHCFWRAQLGNDWRKVEGSRLTAAIPYPPARMKPLPHSAVEGRVNPKGIPCLYLATTETAAMSEVRPWIGAMVSLATFELMSTITVVDCSVFHETYFSLFLHGKVGEDNKIMPEQFNDLVWGSIDKAFAEPVTRADDTAEYAATQILGELFRSEGYDGVAYKSAFGEDGYNIALFDLDAAKQIESALYQTKSIDFKFQE